MKNKLLITTALVAAFSVTNALAAERMVISGSEEPVSGTFENLTADGENGGAIYNSKGTVASIDGTFNSNSAKDGGAIYNGNNGVITSLTGTFIGNTASNRGGAIYNSGSSTIDKISGTFSGNSADKGGAISNAGTTTGKTITISDSTFTGNTAKTDGGAIHNMASAQIKFTGNNVFSGNTNASGLNDIYNNGNVEVNGHLTLDGGISGTGTTTFAEGSQLTVNAGTTSITNNVINNGASMDMIFANGFTGQEGYQLVKGTLDNEFTILNADNGLFTIETTDTNGTYNVVKKASDEIAASTGANANQAATIDAVTNGSTGNETFDTAAGNISSLVQSSDANDVKAAVDAATALAPEAAPLIQHNETQTANQVFSAVSTRLTGGTISTGGQGMSSGDNIFERAAVWVQGLFNHSELDDTASVKGFDADSTGVALGAEKHINDNTKVGLGYAYTDTDIDGFMRSTDVDTHTAFVYGEYKPSNWYVNGIASYGWSSYSEDKNVTGVNIKSDYDAETFGLQAMTGYDMQMKNFGLTPEVGLRYVHISQDGYTDSAGQRVSSNDMDVLTGVIGAKISKNFTLENGMKLKPEARIAATYDLTNDDANSVVTLANGSAYAVEGEALDRFGMEFGAGITADLNDNVEVSAAYEGKFRQDYQDHTGLLNAKYKF